MSRLPTLRGDVRWMCWTMFDCRRFRRYGPLIALLVVATACAFETAPSAGEPALGYKNVRDIELPGNTGRWDYQAVDASQGRLYIAHLGAVWVTDEQGTGDTVIDATAVKNVGSVELGGDIGNTKYDPVSKLVYVAVGSSNQLAAIDPRSMSVVDRAALPGCDGAHGVQLTSSPHRAFVGCEGNNAVVVLDLATKQVLAHFQVGNSPDVLAYDPGLQRVYIACEDGTLAAIAAADPVRKLGQGKPDPSAHTVAVDPATHLVYLPLMNVGGHPVLRVMSP